MKLIKVTFLGLVIWLLTLIWPDVNLWLSQVVMLGAIMGVASLIIGYLAHQPRRRGMLVAEQALSSLRTADSHPLKPIRMT